MQSRYERMERLKAVEREFQVVRDALDRLSIVLADGRIVLPDSTTSRDLNAARHRLEATFLIRLWAEFEVAVRFYHGWIRNDPESNIRAIDLINTVFASHRFKYISDKVRVNVHEVRVYRNSLVHDRDDLVTPISISEARRRLNLFLGSKLPERWG